MNTRTVDIGSLLVIVMIHILIAGGGELVKSEVIRDTLDNSDDDKDMRKSCTLSPCPCQCVNTTLTCCGVRVGTTYHLPEQCGRYTCPATHITLQNCHLLTTITRQVLVNLGWEVMQDWNLTLRNCSLDHLILGPDLLGLQVVDIRGNMVGSFTKPDIESIQSVYLSGNNWPCIDPRKEKRLGSKSSLLLGKEMSWLLEDYWSQRWVDKSLTFCNLDEHLIEDEDYVMKKHSLQSFLTFTKKTSSTCPALCDCEMADETINISQDQLDNYKVNVVCTDLALSSLPLHLPQDTIYLNMADNKISSLDLLSDFNPDYRNIERLILTNNSLKSLQGLENSWLQRNGPVLLDVRNNSITQLDTSALEPMLSKASINKESNYFFAGNPWSCNCQNIKTIQEFLEKYSSLIMDTEHMTCSDCDCNLLNLDYKEMCTSDSDSMIWVVVAETFLLVMIVMKLTWDCVQYRRTGHLPWIARHLGGSVPGIARPRWTPHLPNLCGQQGQEGEGHAGPGHHGKGVGKGSSGYITCSGSSSHSSKSNNTRTGIKESSVVRFL